MTPDQASRNSTAAQNLSGTESMMYTATFGNMNFTLAPSMTGEVSGAFGTLPYVSLESVIYSQQIQAQTSPISVMSGANQGTQNIQGSYQIPDTNGQVRVQFGYSQGGF